MKHGQVTDLSWLHWKGPTNLNRTKPHQSDPNSTKNEQIFLQRMWNGCNFIFNFIHFIRHIVTIMQATRNESLHSTAQHIQTFCGGLYTATGHLERLWASEQHPTYSIFNKTTIYKNHYGISIFNTLIRCKWMNFLTWYLHLTYFTEIIY